jgi:MoxR-like ATPase
MQFMTVKHAESLTLERGDDAHPERVHVFDQQEIDALNAAIASRRPLLVRGEPGIGKTQLAEAAAVHLGKVLLPFVVDIRTESRDLMWYFDAVQRLAEAQLLGALGELRTSTAVEPDDGQVKATDARPVKRLLASVRKDLAIENYLHPRPLWWAFHWESARQQAANVQIAPPALVRPEAGCLVLIDEIDKAESDVPNGLLEALGAGSFIPQGRIEPVKAVDAPPLVIITTNEERALPDAFVRRCMVLHLWLPGERKDLIDHLVERGRAHFHDRFKDGDDGILQLAAEMLADDRATARDNHWYPLPGQAEFLDLVRAVLTLKQDPQAQQARLTAVRRYALKKHQNAARRAE